MVSKFRVTIYTLSLDNYVKIVRERRVINGGGGDCRVEIIDPEEFKILSGFIK